MQPKPAADPPKEVGKPLTPPTQITRLRFSGDGKLLAAACFDGTVRRWDVTGKEPAELPTITGHNGWVTGLAFAGDVLYSTDSWGRLTATDAKAARLWTVEAAHDGWARAVAVAPVPSPVATCGKDGFVRLWDRATGKKVGEVATKADTLSVCYAPDGTGVFAGDLSGTAREYDVPAGKLVRTFEAKELYKLDRIQDVGGVKCLSTDAAGTTLFVGGAEPKSGGFVQCVPLLIAFDRGSGKRLWQWKGASDNEGYVTDLAWHPAGFIAATASGQPGQGKFFLLKPGDPQPFFTAPKPNAHSVALSPDGTRAAASLTNADSAGNGKAKGKSGYPSNVSPIQFWQLPRPT